MRYKQIYETPDGFDDILMTGEGDYLTGLWFVGSKDAAVHASGCEEGKLPAFGETRRWLDIYFGGQAPDFTPRYRPDGLTPFREEVTRIMLAIPFGGIMTYGEIAAKIAAGRGLAHMSAQAVGGAVGSNPISIIIPCHRVVGAGGNLTGYGGGINNKAALLALEGHDMSGFFLPATK